MFCRFFFGSKVQHRFLSLSQLLGLPSNETLEIFSRVRQPGGGWRSWWEGSQKSCLGKFAAWGVPKKNQYMSRKNHPSLFFFGECFWFVGMGFFERHQDSNTGWSIKSTAEQEKQERQVCSPPLDVSWIGFESPTSSFLRNSWNLRNW